MSESRIEKLEEKTNVIGQTLTKIETTLERISEDLRTFIATRDTVLIVDEKCKNMEKELKEVSMRLEDSNKEQNERIWNYSIAAAMASSSLSIIIPLVLSLL